MPWWSWILIWGGLVLALLGMYAYLGVRLFRKATAALRELALLAEKTQLLSARSADVAGRDFTPAVLRDYPDVVDDYRRVLDVREARRENRIARGRLLTSADYRLAAAQIKGV
ncbi:hypothetical protein [Planctomonas psychrotolerans]|uniref:hypothetical protein n=1 Tax=Planctomonas psychrotolerans TaxID=2528712 RepID=UPI00123BEA7B|nr:hypothetical protein [Planctomonas psychrotolerans]